MQNNKLKDLYIRRFESGEPCFLQQLREKRRSPINKDRPAYPLLIKLNEEKFNASNLKIMIFGQETNSWERGTKEKFTSVEDSCKITEKSVNVFMDQYLKFYTQKLTHKGVDSPFWTAIRRINKNLNRAGFDPYIVWNNIYKIGNIEKNKNRPNKTIRDFENVGFFDVIINEINIIKPDLIILFTGPNYESRVDKILGISKTIKIGIDIESREFGRLYLNCGIPAIRTYHPNYLFRNKKVNYIDLITNEICK